jgi:glycosyltransferase involved in cell wall biosynthesis
MPYGIPDEWDHVTSINENKAVLTIAVIGTVTELKSQRFLLESYKLLGESERNSLKILIIGACGSSSYAQDVKQSAEKDENITFTGVLTRKQMKLIYEDIDVVACPSHEDCFPIVVTEGMMREKICIISDHVGQTEYLEDEISGLIFESGNADALADKLRWVLNNRDKLPEMGRKARQIYEQNFTLEQHGVVMEQMIESTIRKYER